MAEDRKFNCVKRNISNGVMLLHSQVREISLHCDLNVPVVVYKCLTVRFDEDCARLIKNNGWTYELHACFECVQLEHVGFGADSGGGGLKVDIGLLEGNRNFVGSCMLNLAGMDCLALPDRSHTHSVDMDCTCFKVESKLDLVLVSECFRIRCC